MFRKSRGKALIINVANVSGSEELVGSDKVCDRMKQLWEQLQFEVVHYIDLKAEVSLG